MGKRGGEGKDTSTRYGNEKFTAMGSCLLPVGGLQGAVQSMPQHHPTQERKLEPLSTDIVWPRDYSQGCKHSSLSVLLHAGYLLLQPEETRPKATDASDLTSAGVCEL